MSQDDTHQLLGALLVRVAFLEEEAWKEMGVSGRKGWGHQEPNYLFHDLFLSFCLAKAGLLSDQGRDP